LVEVNDKIVGGALGVGAGVVNYIDGVIFYFAIKT
jgi:hypothetical protein